MRLPCLKAKKSSSPGALGFNSTRASELSPTPYKNLLIAIAAIFAVPFVVLPALVFVSLVLSFVVFYARYLGSIALGFLLFFIWLKATKYTNLSDFSSSSLIFEDRFSFSQKLAGFAFGGVPSLPKTAIERVRLVAYRVETTRADTRDRTIRWKKVIEIDTRDLEKHQFTVNFLGWENATTWTANALSAWAEVPLIRERDDRGQRMMVHPDDPNF